MKTLITSLIVMVAVSSSAQQLAFSGDLNEGVYSPPITKNAYAVNLKEIKDRIGYPAVCQDNFIEGKVYVEVQTDQNGNYITHKMKYATNKFFRISVERNLAKLKFSPAYQNGQKVGTWVPMVFNFNLHAR